MEHNLSVWTIGWDMNLLAATYAGIVSSSIAYYVQGLVMQKRGPVFVTAFSPLMMIIVAIMGSFILAEKIYVGGKLLKKGCRGYLAYVVDTENKDMTLKNVPVVREFTDVFPEELSGLPVDREVDFTIELVPGTTPISIVPYQMAPTELKELKI
ncbi:WAT1-related protein At4g08290-like [Cornus florida]|uniref:WAT1-related protein At4g08290-like n=1 Tax=Cornus florida TaxID=4283 RepID=UPI0028A0D19E|nr:WAT1-related protein At4g08290-like [Cornus florida]